MIRAAFASATMVLACALTFARPVEAQQINSRRVIDMHVNVESENRSFRGSVMEGGKGFRLTLAGVGTFELSPVLLREGHYAVTVKRGPEGAEPEDLRHAETVNVREGVAAAVRSMPRVGLVIEGSRIAAPVAVVRPISYTFTAMPRTAGDQCCVTCGNVKACACAVQADCGQCCVRPCCPPEEITMESRFFPRVARFTGGQCGQPIRDEERLFTPAAQVTRIASSR